ncbi:MAG: glycosyltransferase family A protein, partial [Candidatus Binatia bacterium]
MDEPSAAVPLVSVVVPTFGDAEGLGRCLAALELQTYPADRYEVVVVDNGSRPAVVLPESRRARRLEIEPKPGSYAARNRGVRSSRGEIFAFTDADCAPRADWLEQGVAALGIDPAVHPVAGRIELTFAAP